MMVVAAACLAAAAPAVARAQDTTEPVRSPVTHTVFVTPFLGMYVPLGSLVADSMVRLRPVGAPVIGSRLTFQPWSMFGIEASLGWSPNLIAQSDFKRTIDIEGGLWLASLRTRANFASGPHDELVLVLSPGVGLLHRYGGAWNGMSGTTDAALLLAGGIRFHDKDLPITFVLDLEDFVTRTGFVDLAGVRYGGIVHHDFVWSLGVSLDVGRMRS
jgi:hypothetical protein